MTTPVDIPEKICLEVVARLSAITTVNGYQFTVPQVVRLNRKGDNWNLKNRSMAVVRVSETENEELSFPGNPPAVAYDLLIEVKAIVRDAEFGSAGAVQTTSIETAENMVAAQIRRALTNDGAMWYTMDGNAVNTRIGAAVPFDASEGELNGITIPIVVTYRVSETDPYTVRA